MTRLRHCAGNNESTSIKQKALSNGDRGDTGIGLTLSEFFTSRHGQLFRVCAERLDLFRRQIFQCQHDIVSATRVTD